jgi:hypothetical protein
MVFDILDSLLRLRQELSKLILRHTNNINDTVAKATALSTIYEILLQGLSVRILIVRSACSFHLAFI